VTEALLERAAGKSPPGQKLDRTVAARPAKEKRGSFGTTQRQDTRRDSMVDRPTTGDRSTLQTVALLFGVVFLLVGILGFIPGITSDAPGDFAGDESEAELLGLFQVSVLHNIVHLLFGIAGLALARTWDGARNFLIGGGVVYLLLWVLGLIGLADWVPVNSADNWLHFVLGVAMVGAGYLLSRDVPRASTA
jgi:hypothetical protein